MANGGSSFISGRFIVECIKTHPNLSFAQEREIIESGKYGDEEIRKLLFMHNIRLAVLLSNKYWSRTYDKDDGLQRALIGLWKAAQQFDYSRGLKFSTYCVPKILGEVTYEMRTNEWKMDAICISMDKRIGDSDDGEFTVADIVEKIKRPDADFAPPLDEQMRSLLEGKDIAQLIFKNVDEIPSKYVSDKQKAMFKAFFAADNFAKSLNVMREVETHTYRNIAEMFNCSHQNVMIELGRVMKFLRMRLSALGILREIEDTLHYKLQLDNQERKTHPPISTSSFAAFCAESSSAAEEDGNGLGLKGSAPRSQKPTEKSETKKSASSLAFRSGGTVTNWERFAGIKRSTTRVSRRETRNIVHFRPERGGFYTEETRRILEAERMEIFARAKMDSDKAERFRAALLRREANIGIPCAAHPSHREDSDLSEGAKMRNTMCEAVEAGINGESAPTITDEELVSIDNSLMPMPDGADDGSNDYELEE